jgi:hypothetical protein
MTLILNWKFQFGARLENMFFKSKVHSNSQLSCLHIGYLRAHTSVPTRGRDSSILQSIQILLPTPRGVSNFNDSTYLLYCIYWCKLLKLNVKISCLDHVLCDCALYCVTVRCTVWLYSAGLVHNECHVCMVDTSNRISGLQAETWIKDFPNSQWE